MLECKRCKSPDAIEELCEDCDAIVYARTDRLIRRSRKAKIAMEELARDLSPEGMEFFTGVLAEQYDDDMTISDDELFQRWSESGFENWRERYAISIRILQASEEYNGYADLAIISRRIPTDDNYLAGEIESTTNFKWVQRWQNQ